MERLRGSDGDVIVVRAFAWADWRALWEVRLAQLAEHGVLLDVAAIPAAPQAVPWGSYEWDLHHLDEVYLCGVGGFWLAWAGTLPVGYVGAQNVGRVAEVRRLYVRAEHRRRGIGSHLLSALTAHCAAQGALAVEVWSGPGPARRLYSRAGFVPVAAIGQEFLAAPNVTGHTPGPDEVRLRLDLWQEQGDG